MNRKKSPEPYWEMTTEELGEATKQFDEEFVADQGQPMSAEMKVRWERAKSKNEILKNGHASEQTIAVRLDESQTDHRFASSPASNASAHPSR